MNTLSFTTSERRSDLRGPGGYLIEHVFQFQDDEGTNTGQYTHVFQVEEWEEVGPTITHVLAHPEGDGWTVSLSVTPVNCSDLNIA